MSETKLPSDPQRVKLRASCDGCYVTKVKCDKRRPLCSRCLTYGIDCTYSPSSRSGRVKKGIQGSMADMACNPNPAHGHREQFGAASPPPWYFPLDNDFSPTFDDTAPPLGLDQDYSEYSILESDVILPLETDLGFLGGPMENSNSPFWWPESNGPATKFATSFAEGHLSFPLPSELMFNTPHAPWSQYSSSQLHVTSHTAPGFHFIKPDSPRMDASADPLPNCPYFEDSPQGSQVRHEPSCPAFGSGIGWGWYSPHEAGSEGTLPRR